MNTANGNKGENMKNNCFNCGKPGHYSKNCPERKSNPMGRQQNLFVGHVGEDCVYMAQEQKPAHKTNRDWHLDTLSSDNSNNNMNMEEDSDASDTTRVTSNNTNVNNNKNNTIVDTEDFEAKITEIASWTHDDLAHNTVLGVQTFMTYWDLHSYHWYCYNCNQQLVSTGTDTWEWECPTCKYLEASQCDNEAHWDFGICGRCNNLPLKSMQHEHLCCTDQGHEDVQR
jgi:Zinc knuckle